MVPDSLRYIPHLASHSCPWPAEPPHGTSRTKTRPAMNPVYESNQTERLEKKNYLLTRNTIYLPHPPLQRSASAGSLKSESTRHLGDQQIH